MRSFTSNRNRLSVIGYQYSLNKPDILRFLLFAFLLFILAACTGDAGNVPEGVDAAFAPFYTTMGSERIFGQPITEAFPLTNEGLIVQYFQNLRLEYEAGQPQMVRISTLGLWGYEGLREVVPDEVNGRSRTFPETNQTIHNEFLTFYEEFDGEQILGWPISPQLRVGGVRTQYFENGRLEWRPQLPLDQRVQLGWLGREHFDSEMALIYREFHSAGPVAAAGLNEVVVIASVQSPVVYMGGDQRLFVTVLTPEGDWVPEVAVTAVLKHGDTSTLINLGATNGEGKIVQTLDLAAVPPGEDVALEIRVEANGRVIGVTNLTFQTWW
jgi:hypothetical protein